MSEDKITRRKFMRDAAVGTAGIAVGLSSTKCVGAESSGKDEKKILNYNSEMEYRRLGKTELMVSAVCLGGHWKRVNVMDGSVNSLL